MRAIPPLACHPEPPSFGGRGIWASRAKRRVLYDAIIARLARILINCPQTQKAQPVGRALISLPIFRVANSPGASDTFRNFIVRLKSATWEKFAAPGGLTSVFPKREFLLQNEKIPVSGGICPSLPSFAESAKHELRPLPPTAPKLC